MLRGVVCALAIVASTALADPLPALGRLPRLPAALEVILVDATSGEPVVGATVALGESVAITDARGDATVSGEVGLARLAIYYEDATFERYVALARSPTKRTIRIPHVDSTTPPELCPANRSIATSSEVSSLAVAVVAHAPQIADGHLLANPVMLARLPGMVGVTGANVMDRSEIERTADRTGKRQTYLEIDHVDLGAGCATVETTISIARPRADRHDLLCCCTSTDVYRRRRDGSWEFAANIGAICS